MPLNRRAILPGFALIAVVTSSAAGGDLLQKTVTNPGLYWNIWGTATTNYVSTPQIKEGAAQRVTISPRPGNPWDVGTYAAIVKPVKRGDVLVLVFWARAEKTPPGSDLVVLSGRIYEAGPEGTNITRDATFLIGRQWKRYFVSGTATRDYPPGSLSAGVFLGTGEQTIDFGQVAVLDMGPGYDLSKLAED